MKRISILLLGLALVACKDDDNTAKPESSCFKDTEVYSNDKGIKLNLTSQKWHLKKNKIGGIDVGVMVKGSIEGDSATIRSYGDGLIIDEKLKLNNKKEFNQDNSVYFTSSTSEQEYINASTLIRVFKDKDTLQVEINSCKLKNLK